MFRNIVLALTATAAIGAAALAPTTASAFPIIFPHPHPHWHWHGPHFGIGFYGPGYVGGGGDCYVVRRVVETPFGPRVRRVEVCD